MNKYQKALNLFGTFNPNRSQCRDAALKVDCRFFTEEIFDAIKEALEMAVKREKK